MSEPIVFENEETGETWTWEVPDDLWRDIQAYVTMSGRSLEEVIVAALTDFFRARRELARRLLEGR